MAEGQIRLSATLNSAGRDVNTNLPFKMDWLRALGPTRIKQIRLRARYTTGTGKSRISRYVFRQSEVTNTSYQLRSFLSRRTTAGSYTTPNVTNNAAFRTWLEGRLGADLIRRTTDDIAYTEWISGVHWVTRPDGSQSNFGTGNDISYLMAFDKYSSPSEYAPNPNFGWTGFTSGYTGPYRNPFTVDPAFTLMDGWLITNNQSMGASYTYYSDNRLYLYRARRNGSNIRSLTYRDIEFRVYGSDNYFYQTVTALPSQFQFMNYTHEDNNGVQTNEGLSAIIPNQLGGYMTHIVRAARAPRIRFVTGVGTEQIDLMPSSAFPTRFTAEGVQQQTSWYTVPTANLNNLIARLQTPSGYFYRDNNETSGVFRGSVSSGSFQQMDVEITLDWAPNIGRLQHFTKISNNMFRTGNMFTKISNVMRQPRKV